MKKPSLKSALVAFFGSRTAVGEGSLKAWGAQQRPPVGASTAEALADELVAEGVASVEERSGGRRVWRLVREEPVEPEPVPEEEPVAVAGGEEPSVCAWCEQRKADPERGALEDQLDQARAHAARCEAERDAVLRDLADLRKEAGREMDDLRNKINVLRFDLSSRTGERDTLAREVTTLRQERDAFTADLATALGLALPPPPRGHLLARVAALLDEARAAAAAPALDQGAIAHYLLSLPGDRWASLATARQQLAQAREMAHAAQLLEASALAAVDGLLSAPAAAPEPSPALQPQAPAEPAPQAKRGPRTEDGEPAPGTARAKILAWIRQQPDATARVMNVAGHFNERAADMSAVLTGMTRAGYLKRVEPGIYQAVKP